MDDLVETQREAMALWTAIRHLERLGDLTIQMTFSNGTEIESVDFLWAIRFPTKEYLVHAVVPVRSLQANPILSHAVLAKRIVESFHASLIAQQQQESPERSESDPGNGNGKYVH